MMGNGVRRAVCAGGERRGGLRHAGPVPAEFGRAAAGAGG